MLQAQHTRAVLQSDEKMELLPARNSKVTTKTPDTD